MIDPNSLLETQTLGIAPKNTSLMIKYRFGGGLSHNVSENSIRTINDLKMMFMKTPSPGIAESVRASATVNNHKLAGGGLPAPTLEDLRAIIPELARLKQEVLVGLIPWPEFIQYHLVLDEYIELQYLQIQIIRWLQIYMWQGLIVMDF